RPRRFVPCRLHAARADQDLRRGPGFDPRAARHRGDPIARRAGVRTPGIAASTSPADVARDLARVRRALPAFVLGTRRWSAPSPGLWRRAARWWLEPTGSPAPKRFSKAVLSSA